MEAYYIETSTQSDVQTSCFVLFFKLFNYFLFLCFSFLPNLSRFFFSRIFGKNFMYLAQKIIELLDYVWGGTLCILVVVLLKYQFHQMHLATLVLESPDASGDFTFIVTMMSHFSWVAGCIRLLPFKSRQMHPVTLVLESSDASGDFSFRVTGCIRWLYFYSRHDEPFFLSLRMHPATQKLESLYAFSDSSFRVTRCLRWFQF